MLMGRNVELELLHTDDVKAIKRFRRAMRLVGMMRHPGVVLVHDVGVFDGRYFVVREDLTGQTLHERCRLKGMITAAQLEPIAFTLLDTLQYVHDRNVVHRGLTNKNVVFTSSGNNEVVKITNFTLARDLGAVTTTGFGSLDLSPLVTLAPEQILEPETADHRADLYAAAAIFFEAITGAPHVRGKNVAELAEAVMSAPTPNPGDFANMPNVLSDAIYRGLSRDPANRFGSAREFWDAMAPAFS